MEGFTITANQSVTNLLPQQEQTKSRKSFRSLFIFLLLVVLVSAGATTYILISRNAAGNINSNAPISAQTNPFAQETEIVNPFTDTTIASESAANPFDSVESANPFDQFDTNTRQAGSSGTYQNPF